MAGFYQDFTTTIRTTEPEPNALIAQLKALDDTAGVQHEPGTADYRLKKNSAWTAPQIAAALNALETAPAKTPQTVAQAAIDAMDIATKAALATEFDELNVIRDWIEQFKAQVGQASSLADLKARVAALPAMPPRTVPQALAAVRAKAGTL